MSRSATGAGPDGGVGEDLVQDVAPGGEHHVDAGLVLDREPDGAVAPSPYCWNRTERTGGAPLSRTSSSSPHRDSCTTPPRTSEWVDVVSLGSWAGPREDVVAGSGQEHRGRCPGGPGPDDDDVVVARRSVAVMREHDLKVRTAGSDRTSVLAPNLAVASSRQYVGLRRCPVSGRRAAGTRLRCARSAR